MGKPTCAMTAAITLGVACGPSPVKLDLPPECNPLRGSDSKDCITPWPSSTYLAASTTTATGYQISVPAGVLPNNGSSAIDPTLINLQDGFSPAGPIVVHFSQGVGTANLPPWTNLAASLDPASPTQILDTQGNRVLQFSEVDVNATVPTRQGLFIRPMVRLQPKTTYVVVLTKDLVDPSGQALPVPDGMEALLTGAHSDNARLEALRGDFEKTVLPTLQKAGIAKDRILLAWDFVTSSDELLTSHILSMRDAALAQVGDGSSIGYTLTSVQPNYGNDGTLYERIVGTFKCPLFLTATGGPTGVLTLDAQGKPVSQGTYDVAFAALVPAQAADPARTQPLPVTVFGHGLLGDAVQYSTSAYMRQSAKNLGNIIVMTNWTGLSAADATVVATAVSDLNALPQVTDKLQQAIINAIVLLRFARGSLAKDPALTVNGTSVVSPTEAYYYGISLGGIMGNTFMAYDPDIGHGVLNVPGGNWSMLLQRSTHWPPLATIFQSAYPDGVAEAFLVSYLQSLFDYSDPVTTAPYVLAQPLTGVPAKELLMQEGKDDMQVSNLATEMTARSMGIPLLNPTDDAPYGLSAATGPVPSALTIYDMGATLKPNVTDAPNDTDNGVHDGVFQTGAANRQLASFAKITGQVTQQCTGASGCVCASPSTACQ